MDFSSLRRFAYLLGKLFWADLEAHHPGIGSLKLHRSRRKSRMDARTRERLPVLPALVSWVEAERAPTAELLAAAESTQPGALFTVTGETP